MVKTLNMNNNNILLTTSDTPRKYFKECIKKGIRRCSNCNEVKALSEFTCSKTGYYSSHCHKCVAKKRRNYVARQKGSKLILFKKKKKNDAVKAVHDLRKSYLKDTITGSMQQFFRRLGADAPYSDIYSLITPEILELKHALVTLNREIRNKNNNQ